MTTPNEVYAIPGEHDIYHFYLRVARVMPIHMDDLNSERFESQTRLSSKTHGFYDCCDGRRYVLFGSLWFDGKPFAIVESAGREGDDHVEIVITDVEAFRDADEFVRRHCTRPDEVKTHRADEHIEGLGVFYGCNFVSVEKA